MKKISFVFLSPILLLIACHSIQGEHGTAIDHIQTTLDKGIDENNYVAAAEYALPDHVQSALMPKMGFKVGSKRKSHKRRFDISVKNAPAKSFFMGLVQGTPYSMVISPGVKGKITLHLKNVTIDEVLQVTRDVYGYEYVKKSFGYEIVPHHLVSQVFHLNYLDVNRTGHSKTEISSGQISEKIQSSGTDTASQFSTSSSASEHHSGAVVETKNEIDFWRHLTFSLKSMIGVSDGHSVVINQHAGVIVVKAYPEELRKVSDYLDMIQTTMQREVIIEAKILEVDLKNDYQAGIDWRIFGARLNALSTFPGTGIVNELFVDAFQGVITSGADFEATIRVLETQGNVQVLSSPRVSTVNNQKAVIKVGQDEFFVTAIATSVTSTSTTETPTQDVVFTPFFSGISLDVTPQIAENGDISLHIHPAVSEVSDQNKKLTISGKLTELPLAQSTIRETDTVVYAKTGQIIVIGGLMKNETKEEIAQVPFVGNIPFLGSLVRNTKQKSRKTELVILLRPIVVTPHVWAGELAKANHRFTHMNEGFHFGGRPDIYGNEGERNILAYTHHHHR